MTDGTELAYPTPDTYHPNGQVQYGQGGLTKRELFAAMAMQGMMLYQTPDGQQPHARAIATWAVQQADALIEALNEGKEKP